MFMQEINTVMIAAIKHELIQAVRKYHCMVKNIDFNENSTMRVRIEVDDD